MAARPRGPPGTAALLQLHTHLVNVTLEARKGAEAGVDGGLECGRGVLLKGLAAVRGQVVQEEEQVVEIASAVVADLQGVGMLFARLKMIHSAVSGWAYKPRPGDLCTLRARSSGGTHRGEALVGHPALDAHTGHQLEQRLGAQLGAEGKGGVQVVGIGLGMPARGG